ncbi:MAG TPA: SRPBCC family protein [Streptosporangiaceae bacterium]|nr:SRPBCC family protein [Streptosporangiaceae bacterium]
MTERSVIHDTFSIERTYPAAPSRVFTAFASKEAKEAWGDDPDVGSADGASMELDFRPGGRERFGFKYQDKTYSYDALYYDIVPDQRIVYSYEMHADGVRISVSVATIEFVKSGDETTLTWTEQGVYLDGIDGSQAPALRREGTAEMLEGLARYMTAQLSS